MLPKKGRTHEKQGPPHTCTSESGGKLHRAFAPRIARAAASYARAASSGVITCTEWSEPSEKQSEHHAAQRNKDSPTKPEPHRSPKALLHLHKRIEVCGL
jgi:hypothetical protein